MCSDSVCKKNTGNVPNVPIDGAVTRSVLSSAGNSSAASKSASPDAGEAPSDNAANGGDVQDQLQSFAHFLSPKNFTDIESKVKAAVRGLGFDNCLLASRGAFNKSPICLDLHDCPETWIERYLARNYASVDPVMKYCLSGRHYVPLLWGFSQQYPSKAARDMHEDAIAHGICSGIAIPFVELSKKTSVFFVSLKHHGREAHDFLSTRSAVVRTLACYLKEALSLTEVLYEVRDLPQHFALTQREIDCLSWAAAGKTAWETGQILNISEWTVVYHFENIKKKLGVYTKKQMIARAIVFKLISV